MDTPLETYSDVETSDKYLLNVYRVKPIDSKNSRPVVFLMHAIYSSGYSFLIPAQEKSLAVFLSKSGYDVWIGNSRGTLNSLKHTTLNPDANPDYWNFSVHEMAVHDIAAIINLILSVTKCKKMSCIGHSQGAMLLSIFLSEKSEYNEVVNCMVLLAPAALSPNTYSPFLMCLLKTAPVWMTVLEACGFLQFPPLWMKSMVLYLEKQFGGEGTLLRKAMTALFMRYGFGPSDQRMFEDHYPLFLQYCFNTTSTKVVKHYIQLQKIGKLFQFDYGPLENLRYYGTKTSPEYDLSKVVCPVKVLSSSFDYVSNTEDIYQQYGIFPNAVFHDVKERLGHFDFLLGKDAPELVFKQVLLYLNKYQSA